MKDLCHTHAHTYTIIVITIYINTSVPLTRAVWKASWMNSRAEERNGHWHNMRWVWSQRSCCDRIWCCDHIWCVLHINATMEPPDTQKDGKHNILVPSPLKSYVHTHTVPHIS